MTIRTDKRDNKEWDYSRSNPWPDLVTAMLSVNKFPIEKTFTLWERLREKGLFNPSNYASWSLDEIARQLVSAGYDRGPVITELLVVRLASLKNLSEDLDSSERVLAVGSRLEVASLLLHVKGVGPTVLDNFLLLRGPTPLIPDRIS